MAHDQSWLYSGAEGDTTCSLTTFLLNGKNYVPWSRLVTIALKSQAKHSFIKGNKPKPIPKDPQNPTETEKQEIENWEANDHLVMSWLLNSMEPQIAEKFMFSNTSFEMWKDLEERYFHRHKCANIYNLKQEIQHEKQGSKSVTTHLGYLMARWNELKVYLPPTTDLSEFQKREEQDRIFQFLSGLDSRFDAIRSQIMFSSELPSFATVVAMVKREETRQSAMGHEERCSHCRKVGHKKERCWFLYPHLRPNRRGSRLRGGRRGGDKGELCSASGNRKDYTANNGEGFNSRGANVNGESRETGRSDPSDEARLDELEQILRKFMTQISQQNLQSDECSCAPSGPKYSEDEDDW